MCGVYPSQSNLPVSESRLIRTNPVEQRGIERSQSHKWNFPPVFPTRFRTHEFNQNRREYFFADSLRNSAIRRFFCRLEATVGVAVSTIEMCDTRIKCCDRNKTMHLIYQGFSHRLGGVRIFDARV